MAPAKQPQTDSPAARGVLRVSKALTLTQAAKVVGVHPATLMRWIEDGDGPRALIRQGPTRRTIRITPAALERWMAQNSAGAV